MPARQKAGQGFSARPNWQDPTTKDIVCNTLCATDEGRILERLENCHLKVLKRRDENPSPAELADPGDRDEALLKKQLDRFCRLFSLHAPVVKLEYLPGEKGSQDAESREMEVRLVRRAAAEVFGKDAAEVEQLDVRWTNDEKTAVSLPHGDEAYFSTARDDRLAICAFAPFVQGCATASIGGGQGNTEQEQAGKEGQALPELLMRQGGASRNGRSDAPGVAACRKKGGRRLFIASFPGKKRRKRGAVPGRKRPGRPLRPGDEHLSDMGARTHSGGAGPARSRKTPGGSKGMRKKRTATKICSRCSPSPTSWRNPRGGQYSSIEFRSHSSPLPT